MNIKGQLAAQKAVTTLRNNLLSKTDINQVQDLCTEIIAIEFAIDDDFSRDAIICREIAKTSWKSFCRFGDRRNVSQAMILCWIDNKGMPLDEQAMWISQNYSMDILPDELAGFMMEFDRGKSAFPAIQNLQDKKRLFKELTGFNFNAKFARQYIIPKPPNSEIMPF